MVCRTTNENEMGRFAKLLLRLPGENILFFPAHFFLGPVRTNILIHHFCLTCWKSWDCNLRRSYGSAAQLPILKISLCKTKLNQTLTQNSLPLVLWPKTVHILKIVFLHLSPRSPPLHWSPMYGTSLLPSHCRRGLHHFLLFDNMQQQDPSFPQQRNLHFLSKELCFSGEHQRHWLTSLWLVGGRPGLNWDLWQKWSNKVPAPWILRDQKTDTFLKIFNHLVFEPTPAMNSIVYVERV